MATATAPPDHQRPLESTELLHRVCQLHAALQAATRDNADLQHQLSRTRAENRRLRDELTRLPACSQVDRRTGVQEMLSEPCSRNP